MDELDALRHMRTALAEQERPDRLELRIGWRPGTVVEKRRRLGLKVPLVGLAATAAVTAGAVVAASLMPGGAPSTTSEVDGGNVLLVAAANARQAPGGRYWHTKRIMGEIYAVGQSRANHYKVDSRQAVERWTDRSGKGRMGFIDLTDAPVTAQDKRKWQAAGSPIRVPIPDYEGAGGDMLLDMRQMPEKAAPMWMPDDGSEYSGLTAKQVAELPTDPKALENALLGMTGNWRAYTSENKTEPIRALKGQERVRALTEVAGALLSEAPAPPRVRAAAFRMLANQPGIKVEGEAADPLGRTGSVVSLPLTTTVPLGLYTVPKQLGTYRRQWIIDPAKGTLLAVRDLVVTPPRGSRRLPPGDDGEPRYLKAENMPDRFHRPGELAGYKVFEFAEWTDATPPH